MRFQLILVDGGEVAPTHPDDEASREECGVVVYAMGPSGMLPSHLVPTITTYPWHRVQTFTVWRDQE